MDVDYFSHEERGRVNEAVALLIWGCWGQGVLGIDVRVREADGSVRSVGGDACVRSWRAGQARQDGTFDRQQCRSFRLSEGEGTKALREHSYVGVRIIFYLNSKSYYE